MPISGREVCRRLQKDGWHLSRIRGSHHSYNKGGKKVVVPVHGNKSLQKGTLHALAKETGLNLR